MLYCFRYFLKQRVVRRGDKCISYIHIDGKYILLDAVHQVLEDASFRTKSPVAIIEAWQAAVQMNEWCKKDANESILQQFSQKLATKLTKTLRIDAHGIPNR